MVRNKVTETVNRSSEQRENERVVENRGKGSVIISANEVRKRKARSPERMIKAIWSQTVL